MDLVDFIRYLASRLEHPSVSKLPIHPRIRRIAAGAAAATAAATAAALVLAGCSSAGTTASNGGSVTSGGTYNLGIITPTGDINPLTTTDYDTMWVVGLASAGLIIQSTSGQLQPQLATSWTQSANKLSWTITLRPGAKFSNGKPVTAQDVVWTFDQILSPTSQSPAASSFDGVLKSVKAEGTDTVVFTLDAPYSDFPYLLTGANTDILPTGDDYSNWINDPVGAGQFILEKYTPGESVTYKKNPNYWDASAVKLSGIDVKFFNDAQDELLAFQSGEIDEITSTDDPSVVDTLGTQYRHVDLGYAKFDAIAFNVTKAPFNNVKVRQAIAWALNRKAIVSTAYAGAAVTANDYTTFPDYSIQPQGITVREQNDAEVKQLLGGQKISFTITTYQGEQTLAELIQQQLQATGDFTVKLDVQTEAAYYGGSNSTTPWLNAPVTITDWADRLPSQLEGLIYATGSDWNASHFSDPALDKLTTEYEATTDTATRQSLANQIAQIEWTEVPVIVAAFEVNDTYLSSSVQGSFPNGQEFSGGFDFRGISISG
jgi:peptide/nickel transport system substrate-binding protein